MIDRAVIGQHLGDYERDRADSKLGIVPMVFMFIKSTIGLAIFGYHVVFKTSGYAMGSIISILFIYNVIHGSMRIVTYAEELEERSEKEGYTADTYGELAELMYPEGSLFGKIVGPVILILNFLSCIGYIIGTTLAFSENLKDILGLTDITSRLAVLVITMIFLFMMKQPEKLVYLSYFTVSLVVVLVLTSTGFAVVSLIKDGLDASYIEATKYEDISISSGYAITCLEVINYVLNIRRMMVNKSQFKRIGYSSLYFCSVLYLFPGLLMYLAYGREIHDVQLYYKIFTKYWPVKILNYLMNVNFLYGMCSLTMFNMEMLEKVKAVQVLLRDEQHNLRTVNVLICRFVFLGLVIFASLFIHDLRIVNAITGIFLNSFVGMIIPGILGFTRLAVNRKQDTTVTKLSDLSCIILGLGLVVVYILERV